MNKDLTRGPVMRSMLWFALPMILGNLLQQCYNIADTLIVGRFLGKTALAAVGSAAKQNPPAQQAPASCTGGNIKWSSSGFRPPPAWPDSSGPLRRPV